MNPPTLAQWLARLRREFGVQCRLDGGGRVRVSGLRKLPASDKAALFASALQVQQLLERRGRKRRKKKDEEQQHGMAKPERPRQVIGQHVVPGYPSLTRPLYADQVKAITPSPRARQLPSFAWTKFVGGE